LSRRSKGVYGGFPEKFLGYLKGVLTVEACDGWHPTFSSETIFLSSSYQNTK